jgi:Fur family ferric uptake transcriptional regulator
MDETDDGVRNYLYGKKLQWTAQRELILQEVLRSRGHFDAEELVARLRGGSRKVSRATVYRTLPRLRECGLIREAFRRDGRWQYERIRGHHDHMLCIRCGRIIEFKEDEIERLQDEVCCRYGFKPLEHRMGIQGICRECQRTDEGAENGHPA